MSTEERPWKIFQRQYNEVVKTHTDDLDPDRVVVDETRILESAVNYFKEQSPISIYPGKSFAVAVIYAVMIKWHYGVDAVAVLHDPDLFLGQDPHYKTYPQAKEIYDQLFIELFEMEKWYEGGWAPQTIKYFKAECTQDGLLKAIDNYLTTGVAVE